MDTDDVPQGGNLPPAGGSPGLARLRASSRAEAIRLAVLRDQAAFAERDGRRGPSEARADDRAVGGRRGRPSGSRLSG
jgi:hypothetical protein